MLSQAQRTTILELNTQGVSKREIARVLGISRVAVRKVLRTNSTTVPELHRTEKAEPYRQQILELFEKCKGNLVRVHEELVAGGAELSYTALTAFCRRHGIGYAPPVPAGRYDFAPGVEMQHDTSPHDLELGGKKRRVQTASAVLCYSRMLFFQCYPAFRRFDCKVFLTEALRYFSGATGRVMIDNTHVVVLRGSGRDDGSGAGDGRLWRAFRFSVCGARDWECEPFGARGEAFLVHREQLSGGSHLQRLGGSESAGAGMVR
jgi:transposase